jgi:hypothetical protein
MELSNAQLAEELIEKHHLSTAGDHGSKDVFSTSTAFQNQEHLNEKLRCTERWEQGYEAVSPEHHDGIEKGQHWGT